MTIDHSLLADVNQIIIDGARDFGPQIGADVQVWRQPAIGGRLEPEPVRGIAKMKRRRMLENPAALCSGPGKLSEAVVSICISST